MRVRKLQQLNDDQVWVDEAYAYENAEGHVVFRYNVLTWGRVGASCNVKIRETETPLEAIETIIPADDELRWLPIEAIEGQTMDKTLAALDAACDFPQPQSIAHKLKQTLAA